jgi:hypothetical protein
MNGKTSKKLRKLAGQLTIGKSVFDTKKLNKQLKTVHKSLLKEGKHE